MVRIMREVTDPNLLAQLEAPEQQQEPGYLQQAAEFTQKYISEPIGRPLGAAATGVVSGLEKSLASLGNLALMPFTEKRIPYYDPSELARTPAERALMFGGEMAGQMAPVIGVSGKVSKAMQAPTLLKEMGLAAGTGFAFGGTEQDDMYNRFVSAGLGAGITGALGLTSKAIGKKVLERANKLETKYKGQYQDIFKSLKDSNLHKANLRVPEAIKNIGDKEAAKAFKPQLKRSLAEFTKNPNFENAHQLQSLLNKNRLGADRDVANLATDLQRRLRGEMAQFLTKNQKPELLKKYIQTTAGYRDEMAPYLTKAVKEFKAGKDKPKQLLKSLIEETGKTGKSKLYSEIPGFGFRKGISDLPEPIKDIGKGAALGLGATGAGILGLPYAESLVEALKKG